jgi:hypothetical protein
MDKFLGRLIAQRAEAFEEDKTGDALGRASWQSSFLEYLNVENQDETRQGDSMATLGKGGDIAPFPQDPLSC